MIYTLEELKALVLPMLRSMDKGQEEAVSDAIVDIIRQDREARDAETTAT